MVTFANSDDIPNINRYRAKFSMGKLVATPAALQALREAQVHEVKLLARHVTGDWGELDDFDRSQNEKAIVEGERILSRYNLPNGQGVYVITEADRSYTTILLVEEY